MIQACEQIQTGPAAATPQLGLFREDFTHRQQFDQWKATPYGAHLLQHIYRTAASYGDRHKRIGRQVSMKLIFELVRDRLPWIKRALARRGIKATKTLGFALNNNFTAPAARHLISRRPDWSGLFELRNFAAEEQNVPAKAKDL